MILGFILYYVCYICTGFVYGAKDKKKLQLFIDDLNLPQPDQYQVQRCNEVTICSNICEGMRKF